ncbi:MAG: site-2 protease family protein [Anaerolineae bacterium]
MGRIFGIPIRLDYSWFLIFALVTWALASGYFPAEFGTWPTYEYWVVGAATAVLFFVSVLLHELAHSAVALHNKIPVKGINLFIFGGISQIEQEPQSAGIEFVMSVVGPLTSFVLGAVFYGLAQIVTFSQPLLALTRYLAYINVLLGAFNLIPGFPLDGGRVFRSIVWGVSGNQRRATSIAGWTGRIIGFGFIAVGVFMLFGGNLFNGLWIGFIGWFLQGAAHSEMQQQEIQDLLAGRRVSQAMHSDYIAIRPDISLQQLVDKHILGNGSRSFVVEEADHVDGLLTLHNIRELPRDRWGTTTAAEAMIPLAQVKRIAPDAELWDAIEEMNQDGVNQLPVMTDGHIEGMLRREDVLNYMRNLRELSHN